MSLQEVSLAIAIAVTILGFIGQGAFVVLFSTRKWRDNRLTKALMNKSFSFFLLFAVSVGRLIVRGPRRGVDDPTWFIVATSIVSLYILFAIWYQLFALIAEIKKGSDVPFLDDEEVPKEVKPS